MNNPIHYRIADTLSDGNSSKTIYLNPSFPDTNYHVSLEFNYDAGSWWITNKQTNYFDFSVANVPSGFDATLAIEVYYDTRDGGV
jgi:hypothetical protein